MMTNTETLPTPTETRDAAVHALLGICDGIVAAVEHAGPSGAPAGAIYAALATVGCTFSQFQSLMKTLVAARLLRQSGDLYFPGGAA